MDVFGHVDIGRPCAVGVFIGGPASTIVCRAMDVVVDGSVVLLSFCRGDGDTSAGQLLPKGAHAVKIGNANAVGGDGLTFPQDDSFFGIGIPVAVRASWFESPRVCIDLCTAEDLVALVKRGAEISLDHIIAGRLILHFPGNDFSRLDGSINLKDIYGARRGQCQLKIGERQDQEKSHSGWGVSRF